MADLRREGAPLSRDPQNLAVAIRGLKRAFGHVYVLHDLDLDVAAGETVALFGSNGAGKTTLLRVIAGLARPGRGSVRVLGTLLPGDAALRRRIGYLGHETFLYSDLTGAENLSYYARLYGVGLSRVEALLYEVELQQVAQRPVRTYSRGMAQRLSLARALLHEPELLLLDEPFTGLDPHGSEVLIRQLGALRAQGTTVLLTTHDFAIGLEVSDRAVLLNEGRVAWESGSGLIDAVTMKSIYLTTVIGG